MDDHATDRLPDPGASMPLHRTLPDRPCLTAPPAPKRSHTLTRSDGTVVEGPRYWLREREDVGSARLVLVRCWRTRSLHVHARVPSVR